MEGDGESSGKVGRSILYLGTFLSIVLYSPFLSSPPPFPPLPVSLPNKYILALCLRVYKGNGMEYKKMSRN